MNKMIKFDFSVFSICFLDVIISKQNVNQPEVLNYILLGKHNITIDGPQISEYKSGSRQIPSHIKKELSELSVNEIAERFMNLINLGNQSRNDTCIKEISDRLFSFRQMVKTNVMYSDLDDLTQYINHRNIYKQLANLFLLSLKVKNSKKKKEDMDRIRNFIAGEYLDLGTGDSNATFDRFIGLYYVYYYSAHYKDKVHCGLLKIYKDEYENLSSRLIFGINKLEKLEDEKLRKAIEAEDNEEAKNLFELYRSTFPYRYDSRFYLFNGRVFGNEFYLNINYQGVGNKSDHRTSFTINIARAFSYKQETQYKGGLGIMISFPNSSTPKVRAFRMGIADVRISLENEQLKEILKLDATEKQRFEVQKDDDIAWWDMVLQIEAEGNNK